MATIQGIGVDLGGTNLRAAVIEIEGDHARVVRQVKREVGAERGPAEVGWALAELVRSLDAGAGLPVGIGVAGMLRGTTGVVANAPNLGWRDVPFAEIASQRLGQPVWLENDLSAITWGEQRFGAARQHSDVLCVFVGTGVGAGVVCDGELYRGASNASVEIGHVKVVTTGGRACGCGAHGCLEAYAGGRHLGLQGQESPSPLMLELVQGEVSRLHAGIVDEAAVRGDQAALAIIDRAGRMLGETLATAVTLFNPRCLLMGGTVWTGCPRLRSVSLEHFARLANAPAYEAVEVIEATLGDDAGVFGAADLARRQFAARND